MSARITRATLIPSSVGAEIKRYYSLNSTGLTHAQSAWNTFIRFAREEFTHEFAQINREIPHGVHQNTLYSLVREHYEPQYKIYLGLYDGNRPEAGVDWWKSTVSLMKDIRFSPADYINKHLHLAKAGAGAGAGRHASPGPGPVPAGFLIMEGLDESLDEDVDMSGTHPASTTHEMHEMILGGVRYTITQDQMHSIYSIITGGVGGSSPGFSTPAPAPALAPAPAPAPASVFSRSTNPFAPLAHPFPSPFARSTIYIDEDDF